jgi:thymidylate kinase
MFPLDLARYQTIKRVIQTSASRGDLVLFERVFDTYVLCGRAGKQASDSNKRLDA